MASSDHQPSTECPGLRNVEEHILRLEVQRQVHSIIAAKHVTVGMLSLQYGLCGPCADLLFASSMVSAGLTIIGRHSGMSEELLDSMTAQIQAVINRCDEASAAAKRTVPGGCHNGRD